MSTPTLRLERRLLRQGVTTVAGMDEVGRGAIAGCVSVGVAVVTAQTRTAPNGLQDSKLLAEPERERLFPRLQRWVSDYAVGSSSPQEIDRWGLSTALRLAAHRALARTGTVDHLILDGTWDYVTPPEQLVLTHQPEWPSIQHPEVSCVVKADRSCSSVAAASVLAKVTRDRMMIDLARTQPDYRWQDNKGYSSPEHQAAIARHGLCELHRRSWNITVDPAAALAHSAS